MVLIRLALNNLSIPSAARNAYTSLVTTDWNMKSNGMVERKSMTKRMLNRYFLAMSFPSLISIPSSMSKYVVLRFTTQSAAKAAVITQFIVSQATDYAKDGSKATIKGMLKQLKIASAMFNRSHQNFPYP